MKFSSVLIFASMALAAPTMYEKPQLDARQTPTVVGTINNIVTTLTTTTAGNIQQINDAVAALKNNVDATVAVQLQAIIRANLNAITAALQTATNNILAATNDAVVSIGGDVNQLTDAQIAQIKAAVDAATAAIGAIGASVTLITSDLRPAISQLLVSELTAVKAAIRSFLAPIAVFLDALRNAGASGSVAVTGLTAVLSTFLLIAQGILASLGLSLLGITV